MNNQAIILDNLGGPLIPTTDVNIWIGNLGQPIDIRDGYGSVGAPLFDIPTLEELKIELRNLKLNELFL